MGNPSTSGTRVLICLLGLGEIIWGLQFRGPKYAICGLKFGVDKIIWDLIFPVCYHPNHFLSIKLTVFETGQLIILGL